MCLSCQGDSRVPDSGVLRLRSRGRVCGEPVDLGAYPNLASGDLRFQYKAVVMAVAIVQSRQHRGRLPTYVTKATTSNRSGARVSGQLEDDVQCKDKDKAT